MRKKVRVFRNDTLKYTSGGAWALSKSTGKIIVSIYRGDRVVKRKTVYLYGRYRFQLITSFKILSIISSVKELLDATHARLEIYNTIPDRAFVNNIKAYSPVPVEIVHMQGVKL